MPGLKERPIYICECGANKVGQRPVLTCTNPNCKDEAKRARMRASNHQHDGEIERANKMAKSPGPLSIFAIKLEDMVNHGWAHPTVVRYS